MDDGFLHNLELAGDDRHGVKEHRGQHDPDDSQEPREPAIAEGREGRLEGHVKGEASYEKSSHDATEGSVRRADAEMVVALLVAVRMNGNEIKQSKNRDCRHKSGECDIAQRIVILVVHLRCCCLGAEKRTRSQKNTR